MPDIVLILAAPSPVDRAALTRPLARARAAPVAHGDWRDWLARRLGRADLAQLPPAQLAAPQGKPARDLWFATPVALVATLDHVRLAPEGCVVLAPEEAATLAADFAARLGGAGTPDPQLALQPVGAEGFLLSGLAAQARTHDPVRVLGADIGPWLPTGEGARALRRLGSEIEMWLHGHPLAHAWRERGAPAVTALWLWGGASGALRQPGPQRPAHAWPRGYGTDGWLRGLWRAAGEELAGAGANFVALDPAPDRDTVVVVRGGEPFESHWLAPALAALAARKVRGVQVVIDERVFRFSRFDLLKPWRRTVEWTVPA